MINCIIAINVASIRISGIILYIMTFLIVNKVFIDFLFNKCTTVAGSNNHLN